VGAKPGEAVGLEADAAAVKATLAEVAGNVILCGHSYGGMVISLAGTGEPKVERLVYVCAYVPESGQSLTDIRGGRRAPWVRKIDGGLTVPDFESAASLFYGDCDPTTQQWAMRQLRPQAGAAFEQPVPAPAWKTLTSTYVVCGHDMAIAPEQQRQLFAPRATQVIELDSAHSPFLSMPHRLAEVIDSRR